MIVLILLLFRSSPCVTSLAFNFSTFPTTISTISLDGDAFVDGKFLLLTKSAADDVKDQSVGRATFTQPFLLRQNATGKLADFTTNFTFVIDSQGKTPYAGELAFFIAPNGSCTREGSLGLALDNQYPFVAVEFDTYQNEVTSVEDQAGDHVGVNINSVKSKMTRPWNGSVTNGGVNSAEISYDSPSNHLSVVFTTYVNGVQVLRSLEFRVELHEVLKGWVVVGFTAATGAMTALHKINSWSFNSTELSDERPKNVGLVVGLVVGGSVGLVVGVLVLAWFIFWRQGKTGEISDDDDDDDDDEDPMVNDSIDEEFEKGTGPRKFSYRKLAQSTRNFDEGEKLGEGGFGGVYRGFIKDMNLSVAVKRISSKSRQGMKEYAAEVRIISRLRHRNLVQLIGWCHEKKYLLLVYEFMPNGSLDSHLFKAKSLLAWETRYSIAHGLASGLLYLHEEWEQCVLHRDVKSSNIMLDSNFNAKLGDFGLARLVDHGKQSDTTVLAGTMGYIAPECMTTRKASKETDVYSFGIVALEIACGRKSIDLKFGENQISMVEWVWELYGEGKVIEAADRKLCSDFDEKQMECLLIVGLWCANPDYNNRPSIQQAIQVLNFEVPVPILPSTMPVASYLSAKVSFSIAFSDVDTTGLERGQTESSYYGCNTNSSQFTTSSASNSSPFLYTK